MVDEIQKEVLLMAKITGNYESMVVFSTKAGDEAVAELVAKFKEMIEAKPDFPAELSRVLNITDGVLRSIVINK